MLLEKKNLPSWFQYPREFQRVVNLNLTNLDPWFFLQGEQLEMRIRGLNERYPQVELLPFARRSDNDDVVCWAKEGGNEKVYIIHDYSEWGWKNRKEFKTFWDWYRKAIDDMIEHEQPYR